MICECGTEMEFIGTNWICPKCSGKVNNAKEELERIIRKEIYPITSCLPEKERIMVDNHIATELAQAILAKLPELGFIRLDWVISLTSLAKKIPSMMLSNDKCPNCGELFCNHNIVCPGKDRKEQTQKKQIFLFPFLHLREQIKIKLEKGVYCTQAKGCYCIQIGTWAFMFGNKQGWRIELFTPLHLFRFKKARPIRVKEGK